MSGVQASTSGAMTFNTATSAGSQNINTPNGNNQAFTVTVSVTAGVAPVVLYFKT